MKKIRSQILQNNSKITIPILLLSLALVFTFGTHAVSAADNDTIYVNSSGGNDSWDGLSWGTAKLSIKNATGTVNVNGTVNLANGIYNGPDNRGIVISKNMTIKGQSQTSTVIDAQGADRIFTVNPGVNVTIANLTLKNGSISSVGGPIGGAIYNGGILTTTNAIFKSNTAPHGWGGAIANVGQLTIINTTFNNNAAMMSGAIYTSGQMTVINSIFNNNQGGSGGAIANNGGQLNITNTTFNNNTAPNDLGGAIFNDNVLRVTSSTFENNTASQGSAIVQFGGTANVNFNRIVGNTIATVYSVGGIMNITNNWWGSNSGPAVGSIVGIAYPTTWLILNITASPTTINNGGTSTITADLLHDNTGAYHEPALGHVPDGVQINLTVPWGSFINPAIIHSVTLNTINGGVSAVFHANEGAAPLNPVKVTAAADGYTTTDTESAYITINPAAEVQLIKTASNIKPHVGQIFTFTLTAINNGPDTATGVQIADLIPDGLIFNGYTVSQGTYDPNTGIWMVGTILNGSNAVLNLFVTPTLMLADTKVTNTAVLTAEDQYDPTDDIASASVYVQPVVIVIQKTSIMVMYSIMGCTDPTVKAARTTGMDPTGIPITGFVAAVLMILGGLTIPRKK